MLIHTQTQCMILRTACILAAITQITAKMCISVNYLNLLLGDLKFHRVNSHIRCMNWMHFRLTCSRSFRSLHMHNMFFFFSICFISQFLLYLLLLLFAFIDIVVQVTRYFQMHFTSVEIVGFFFVFFVRKCWKSELFIYFSVSSM